MKSFSALLEKVSKALTLDSDLKRSVREAIEECTGGLIKEDQIEVKEGVLMIDTSPALKSEIRLNEEKIKECVRNKSGRTLLKIQFV